MPSSPLPSRPARPGRAVVWLWLVAVGIAALVAARTTYVADLSAFLPAAPTPEQAVLLDQLDSGVGSRLVLLGIEGGTAEARGAASLAYGRALRASGRFESVENGDRAHYAAFGEFLFAQRYLLSPAVDADRFSVDGLRAAIDDTVALLGTPAGATVKPLLFRDPTGETRRMAEAMLPAQAPRVVGGVWASRRADRAVLVAITRAAGADLDGQQATLDFLRTSFAAWQTQGLTLVLSGAGRFAVESRAGIQHEVERLAVLGSVAIVALLLAAFGSPRALVVALLPVASGVLAGIAAVSLGFGNVHGITLGFGTTLIGEAVDYAIYYLIQARPRPVAGTPDPLPPGSGAREWIRSSWPTVRLGLWTSLCGFAALAFSGFHGLAQLGVFSVAGLGAAALTTRWVFPRIVPDGAPGRGLRRRLGRATAVACVAAPRWRRVLGALAIAALLVVVLRPSAWRGDLQSLSPVSKEALALDAALRADVGAAEPGTLLALSAADEDGVLALAEAAGTRLDRLVADGRLRGYDSPARLVPSRATQLARRAALPAGAELRRRLVEATDGGPLPAARLEPFLADVEAARTREPSTRASLQGTPLGPAVDALLVPGRPGGGPWRALIALQPGDAGLDDATLRAALDGLPGARLVHIGAELAAIYAGYLREATLQALIGAASVAALLAWHLRSWRRWLAVAQPIAAAVVIVLAGLTLAGTALGVLHLVGFLLVVAIGSNYALFFDQLRHAGAGAAAGDDDGDTLASLALANLTAVMSFGLLASSAIPALSAIGLVVAPGTLLCLLLSAAFMPADARRPYGKIV